MFILQISTQLISLYSKVPTYPFLRAKQVIIQNKKLQMSSKRKTKRKSKRAQACKTNHKERIHKINTTKSLLIKMKTSKVQKKISTSSIILARKVIWSLKELKERLQGLLKLKNSKNQKKEGLKCEKQEKMINNHLRTKPKKFRPNRIN